MAASMAASGHFSLGWSCVCVLVFTNAHFHVDSVVLLIRRLLVDFTETNKK